jgi:hypothetical protein
MARPRTNPLTIEKICPTCKKPFVLLYRKKRQRFCTRSCANHHPDVLEKMKQSQQKTYAERYGGQHPMELKDTKERFKQSMQKKHGVDWYGQHHDYAKKVKTTKLEKYGDENYTNREKAKQTCIVRYGVDNICKSEEIMERRIQARKENHYEHLLDFCKTINITPLFSLEHYHGYHFSFCYRFSCNACGYSFDSTVYNLDNLFCEKCDPDRQPTLENRFFDFLSNCSSGIIKRRDRTILYGKELDFLVKDKGMAFELNGLYWHSENGGGHIRNYHLNKTKGCLTHGITLIHIFENEWRDKQEIVKSIIKTKLNDVTRLDKVHARKCELKEVEIKEKDQFLSENHLQGIDKSTIKLGLYSSGKLISLMTFRKSSRFDDTSEWEMVRFCNKLNTIICGGASKLFSYFVRTNNPTSVVSYSDRRYFDGNLYSALGFQFISNTPPSYHYISKDYKYLMNRMQFQKHKLPEKLPIFDATLSEWENMKNNGFDRIWDCGHGKWVWTKQSS